MNEKYTKSNAMTFERRCAAKLETDKYIKTLKIVIIKLLLYRR